MHKEQKSLLQDFNNTCHAKRKDVIFKVTFVTDAGTIDTLEGPVSFSAGSAIVTGINGERWPIERARFDKTYEPIIPTISGATGLYRRLPQVVLAHQLTEITSIELTDGRGKLTGNPNDWIVEYSPGDRAIIACDIFKKTYDILEENTKYT